MFVFICCQVCLHYAWLPTHNEYLLCCSIHTFLLGKRWDTVNQLPTWKSQLPTQFIGWECHSQHLLDHDLDHTQMWLFELCKLAKKSKHSRVPRKVSWRGFFQRGFFSGGFLLRGFLQRDFLKRDVCGKWSIRVFPEKFFFSVKDVFQISFFGERFLEKKFFEEMMQMKHSSVASKLY